LFGGNPSHPTVNTASIYDGSGIGPVISGFKFAVRTGTNNPATMDERFRIDETGKVGIGIATPFSKLQVNSGPSDICAHFGGQNNSDGHIGGISLGYAENANANYRKVAIIAKARQDKIYTF